MKKVLSVLSLIVILGFTTPVFANPHGHSPHSSRHSIHAGAHHRPHVSHHRHHRPHTGFTIHTGYPRHSYWYGYRSGYWRNHWCDYRLGWGNPYCAGYYPVGGTSFSIHF